MDCSGGDEISFESGTKRKLEALGGVLARHNAPRTLVFCNKLETCRTVENYLVRHTQLESWQVGATRCHDAWRRNNMRRSSGPGIQARRGAWKRGRKGIFSSSWEMMVAAKWFNSVAGTERACSTSGGQVVRGEQQQPRWVLT